MGLPELIELILKYLENIGLSKTYVGYFLVFVILIGAGYLLLKFIKYISLLINQRKLNKDLQPYFTPSDIEKATRYYISTKYQNVSPSEAEEPGKYIASAKEYLIPLLLKKAVKNAADDNKYYLILADSGMGKTTFMLNLYLRYKNQWGNLLKTRSFYEIALIPLGSPDAISAIERIENPRNTILLLDSFDEDINAIDRHKERMNEILEKVQYFRVVIITCRTQFFPSEEEEPYTTGYFSFGEAGEYKFQKLYLSVFDDNDVKKYIRKKFSGSSAFKRGKAFNLANISKNLVVRPMLLSYIEDLITTKHIINYKYEVYEALVQKWIERESKKHGIAKKYGDPKRYAKLLYQFSQSLAVDLYNRRKERGGYFIPKDENLSTPTELQLSDIEKDFDKKSPSDTELKSKSLLNRNAQGQYKFSHKSIFEYFLAKELYSNPAFLSGFDFDGMDMAKTFLDEMITVSLRECKGAYLSINLITQKYDDIILGSIISKFDGIKLKKEIKLDENTKAYQGPLSEISQNDLSDLHALTITNAPSLKPILGTEWKFLRKLIIHDKDLYTPITKIWILLLNRAALLPESKLNVRFELGYPDSELELFDYSNRDTYNHIAPTTVSFTTPHQLQSLQANTNNSSLFRVRKPIEKQYMISFVHRLNEISKVYYQPILDNPNRPKLRQQFIGSLGINPSITFPYKGYEFNYILKEINPSEFSGPELDMAKIASYIIYNTDGSFFKILTEEDLKTKTEPTDRFFIFNPLGLLNMTDSELDDYLDKLNDNLGEFDLFKVKNPECEIRLGT